MSHAFLEMIEQSPIIAAIKDDDGLEHCLQSDSQVIFVLYGDLCSIPTIVERIKNSGRLAMVHIDLINGLSTREVAVDYIRNTTRADGIISTKVSLIKRAKELGLYTVLRVFVLDSMSLGTIEITRKQIQPDCYEILPGVMPKIIRKVHDMLEVPLIAGGLISDKEDILAALNAGATSVSSTNQEIWFL